MTASKPATAADRFAASVGSRMDGSPCAIMLDVDGTLAPIAPTPEQASIPAATRQTLARLVRLRDVTLAFVSGRSASDTWRITAVDGAWIIGNHGFEIRSPDGKTAPVDVVRPYEAAIAEAARRLTAGLAAIPGAIVENKRWTMSLHHRLVDQALVPQIIERAREVASQLGLRLTEGKKIVELRPPIDVNKGTAALALAERVNAVADHAALMYAGDDRTDEDAFTALRNRQSRAVTVHVAGSDAATFRTNAEIVVGSAEELRAGLDWIADRRSKR